MSALGQKQTSQRVRAMSALPPKADIGCRDVRLACTAANDDDYSTISSAVASSVCGKVRPSVLAVLRLRTRSNFVGCSTGKSDGFVPCSILCTYVALRRERSEKLAL